jgi:hypothetical protein
MREALGTNYRYGRIAPIVRKALLFWRERSTTAESVCYAVQEKIIMIHGEHGAGARDMVLASIDTG